MTNPPAPPKPRWLVPLLIVVALIEAAAIVAAVIITLNRRS